MRIKYIKQVGFDFDVEEWMTGSGYIKGKQYDYYMRYHNLDCWRLTFKQDNYAVEDYIVIKEPTNLYFVTCEDDETLTKETLECFIDNIFDSVEYQEFN